MHVLLEMLSETILDAEILLDGPTGETRPNQEIPKPGNSK